MTKNELDTFRETLEGRQTELGSGGSNREALAIETSPDEVDRIQHTTELHYAIGNLERNTLGLGEVREALRRIDSGVFGICASCEEQIKPKRLAAVPWASLCIVCQNAADRGKSMSWNGFDSLLAA
jgi:DnaK suppressor protein